MAAGLRRYPLGLRTGSAGSALGHRHTNDTQISIPIMCHIDVNLVTLQQMNLLGILCSGALIWVTVSIVLHMMMMMRKWHLPLAFCTSFSTSSFSFFSFRCKSNASLSTCGVDSHKHITVLRLTVISHY